MRRAQRSFGDGLIDEEVKDLREVWMDHADRLLDDEAVVAAIFQALGRRHPRSRTRGRRGSPAEIVLRLLILKHVRNWSYEVLEREVRANLVYRDFTRVGGGKMPDAKTIGRWGLAVGPETIKQVHERLVQMAQAEGIATGRRMRVDTTVVETNVHYATDSSLLGDGVRVLTRAMKKITAIAGEAGATEAGLRQAVCVHQSGGRPGEAVRPGDRRGGETVKRRRRATRPGRPASTNRGDGAADAAGDETDTGARLWRRHACRREASQPVRAVDGNHPQGQGRQAQWSSARWSSCRRPRTRSLSTTKSTIVAPTTPTC